MLPSKIKVGIIGCGTIGSKLAMFIEKEIPEMEIFALCDITKEKASKLSKEFSRDIHPAPQEALSQKKHPEAMFVKPWSGVHIMSIEELIDKSDLVIETASSGISAEIVKLSLAKAKIVFVLSSGGLIKNLAEYKRLAQVKGGRLYIPSGAIAGLDGLKAISTSKIEYVTLTTKKPIKGIKDAPFIKRNNIDLNSIKTDTVIFSGTVEEAVGEFPQNINVAANLVLSGIDSSLITVRIATSPHFTHNIHEIKAKGEFGQITCVCENLPDFDNPKTSFLAVLSAGAALKQIVNPIKVGT
ncbi:MAG: aspartate dehydrogenase domain-containing protein [bacterium]